MPSMNEALFGRRNSGDDVPVCPDHHVELRLRGKVGRAARFHDQTGSEYTLIYVCPHDDCAYSESRDIRRLQSSIPGAAPDRPAFARVND